MWGTGNESQGLCSQEWRAQERKEGCLKGGLGSSRPSLWRGLGHHELVGFESPLWDGRRGGSKRSRNEADEILIARQMVWEKKRKIFFFFNKGKHFHSLPSIKMKWEPSVLGRCITIISTVSLEVFFLIIAWLSINRVVFSNKLESESVHWLWIQLVLFWFHLFSQFNSDPQ